MILTACLYMFSIFGSILNAIALGYAAQSLLAPLRSITLVANAILATRFLGEKFERSKIIGIVLVVAGSVCSVLFGPSSSTDDITMDYIKSCWQNIIFIIFFASLSGVMVVLAVFVKLLELKNIQNTEDHEIIHGGTFLLGAYCTLAAYFGSVNMLFMKSLVTELGTFEVSYLVDWFFWSTIAVVIGVNVALEFFRQRALYYFDAVYVVPIFSVLLILGSSVMGGVFFHEFDNLESLQLILFPVSILVTLFGVGILAYNVGAMYSNLLQKLHLKAPKTLDPAMKAKEQWQHKRGIATQSVWGGLSQFGTEYYRRMERDNHIFEPHAVRKLKTEMKTKDDRIRMLEEELQAVRDTEVHLNGDGPMSPGSYKE